VICRHRFLTEGDGDWVIGLIGGVVDDSAKIGWFLAMFGWDLTT